jgi:hypothetical protein
MSVPSLSWHTLLRLASHQQLATCERWRAFARTGVVQPVRAAQFRVQRLQHLQLCRQQPCRRWRRRRAWGSRTCARYGLSLLHDSACMCLVPRLP